MAPLRHATWRVFISLKHLNDDRRVPTERLVQQSDYGNSHSACRLAQRHIADGDYDKAFEAYNLISQSKFSAYNIGAFHDLGLGSLNASTKEAMAWYAKAGDLAEARHRIGFAMVMQATAAANKRDANDHVDADADADPVAVAESEVKAETETESEVRRGMNLVRIAANAGVIEAMFDLGMMYLMAVGVEANDASEHIGEKWLRRVLDHARRDASKVDVAAEASFQLAYYYYTTLNSARSTPAVRDESALKCAEFAGDLGHAIAQDFAGQLHVKGHGESRAPNRALAREWFRKAGAQNVVSATRDLALLIEAGEGAKGDTPKDFVELYKFAAGAGDSVAIVRLALCYGRGIPGALEKDPPRALEMILNVAREGSVMAMAHAVGREMVHGNEVKLFIAKLASVAGNKKHPDQADALRSLVSLGLVPSCANCHKAREELGTSLKECSKCQAAQYCSEKCQTEDWKTHAKECAKIVASRKQKQAETAAVAEAVEKAKSESVPEDAGADGTPTTKVMQDLKKPERVASHSDYDSMPDNTETPDSDSDGGEGEGDADMTASEGTTPSEVDDREAVLPRSTSTGTLVTTDEAKDCGPDIADGTPLLDKLTLRDA